MYMSVYLLYIYASYSWPNNWTKLTERKLEIFFFQKSNFFYLKFEFSISWATPRTSASPLYYAFIIFIQSWINIYDSCHFFKFYSWINQYHGSCHPILCYPWMSRWFMSSSHLTVNSGLFKLPDRVLLSKYDQLTYRL